MTDAEIIAEYERREAQGQYVKGARQIAEETAQALGLPYERVRDVLISVWTCQGAG